MFILIKRMKKHINKHSRTLFACVPAADELCETVAEIITDEELCLLAGWLVGWMWKLIRSLFALNRMQT